MSTTVFDQHEESSQDEKAGKRNSQMHSLDSTLTKNLSMMDECDGTHMQVEGSDKEENPGGVRMPDVVMIGDDVEMDNQNIGDNVTVIDQLPTPRDQEPKASSTMIQRTQIGDNVTVIDDEDDEEITVISMVSSATMRHGKNQIQELEMQKVEAAKRKKLLAVQKRRLERRILSSEISLVNYVEATKNELGVVPLGSNASRATIFKMDSEFLYPLSRLDPDIRRETLKSCHLGEKAIKQVTSSSFQHTPY